MTLDNQLDMDQLPLEQWAGQLKHAREQAGIGLGELGQDLRLSSAQIRGIEAGSVSAFHGPGYYLRAVEKYALHLDLVLEPPVTELKLTDSQIALKKVKNTPSASKLAKNQANVLGASAMPGPMRRTRIGLWLAAVLLVLVGTGTWMSINEGWPGGDDDNVAGIEQTNTIGNGGPVAVSPSPTAAQAPNSTQVDVATVATSTSAIPTTDLLRDSAALNATTGDSAVAIAETITNVEPAVPQPAVPQQTVPESATPTPPTSPADIIEASFTDDCWVEIRRVDGSTEQGIYKQGQTIAVAVQDIERLSFGNAGAVNATRAGAPFDVTAFIRSGSGVARISGSALTQ